MNTARYRIIILGVSVGADILNQPSANAERQNINMTDEELQKIKDIIETERFKFGQLRDLWFSIERRIQCGRRKTKLVCRDIDLKRDGDAV